MTAIEQKEHFVCADGAQLRVIEWPALSADAPTVLLVHGYRANAHWWDCIVPELLGKCRMILPEFSGMGGSEARSEYARNQGAEDLCAVIEHLDLCPDWVLAHSWGGHQMAHVVRKMPERIGRLVWIDSFLMVDIDEELPDGPPIGNTRVYEDKDTAVARFRTSPPQPIPESVRQSLAANSLRKTPEGWVWSYDSALPMLEPQYEDEVLLKDLPVTSYYILAGSSPVVGPARAERIAALAGSKALITIAGGHHHVMLDAPDKLLATLKGLDNFPL
ncbi:alpha/beta hydrolase [Spongiibacter sp. KMU-166]|uniref:Alpha/beta hydrolase n=1 Tax=Spongiibacter thalassae TaxID=2721624 RepID=A0ABX1GB65_9GAMM|nr:alpha/beta hydrolase [Spongiibacter thalassae]NKI16399.1 alpha/beta hydrolase [Spongiibacter thalassae]